MPTGKVLRHRALVVMAVLIGVTGACLLAEDRGSVTAQFDRQVIQQLAVQAEVAPLTLPFKVLGNTVLADASVAGTVDHPNVAVAT